MKEGFVPMEVLDEMIRLGWGHIRRIKIPEDWRTITPAEHFRRMRRQREAERQKTLQGKVYKAQWAREHKAALMRENPPAPRRWQCTGCFKKNNARMTCLCGTTYRIAMASARTKRWRKSAKSR